MIPTYDIERGQYGLKERILGKMYAELLSLPVNEKEALINFKNPKKQPPGWAAGDFPTVLNHVLKNRVGQSAGLTVTEINNLLDKLANSIDRDGKKKTLSTLLHNTNALEQHWLVKIIIKDLKIGTHEKVLSCFHPKALELFYNTNNLREVFSKLKDKNIQLGTQLFQLHRPIKPMLAARKPYKEILKLLINADVYVETKYDGERIQCHYSSDGTIHFFSRNANDFTYLYGSKMRDLVLQNIRGVEACILDGEMIVWDSKTDSVIAHGHNRTVALEKDEQTGGLHLCYKIFDIMYIKTIDGIERDLMQVPLSERRMILERTIQNVHRRLEISEAKRVLGTKAVIEEFNQCIINNDEGLLVKQHDSVYIPEDRSTRWLKLKADYFEGLGDSLDVLIVGGYYGQGFRSRSAEDSEHITVFLVAVVAKLDSKTPMKSKFLPCCKVGIGYTIPELKELRQKLRKHWKQYNPMQPPKYWRQWEPASSERPDLYIMDPSESVILEVRAAELVPTEKYPTGLSLRFPKVNRIRYDKPWDQCMTLQEYKDLRSNFTANMTEKTAETLNIEDGDLTKNTRPQRKAAPVASKRTVTGQVVSSFKDTDTSNVRQTSNIFQGYEFYVATSSHKAQLEVIIVSQGGSKVQNYLKSTNFVIASDTTMKVKNLIKSANVSIIKPEWIHACVKHSTLLPFKPKHMLHANQEMQEQFEREFTSYGDGFYALYNDPAEYNEMEIPEQRLDAVIDSWGRSWFDSIPSELRETLGGLPQYRYYGCLFFVYDSTDYDPAYNGRQALREVYEIRLESYGAEIAQEMHENVSHVLTVNGDEPDVLFPFELVTIDMINAVRREYYQTTNFN